MNSATPASLCLLTLLQHGDSQFPAGSFAYSGGLEGLLADGCIAPEQLPDRIASLLHTRWARYDRVAMQRAWLAADAPAALDALDAEVEATLLAPVERLGSRRAGAALLTTHLCLGTPGAAALRGRITAARLHGHRAIVEGVLWRGLGLGAREATLLSGYAFVNALGTAALRLGQLGALAQQRMLAALAPLVAELAEAPLPPAALPRGFNPLAEIAMMRQAARDRVLFAT